MFCEQLPKILINSLTLFLWLYSNIFPLFVVSCSQRYVYVLSDLFFFLVVIFLSSRLLVNIFDLMNRE